MKAYIWLSGSQVRSGERWYTGHGVAAVSLESAKAYLSNNLAVDTSEDPMYVVPTRDMLEGELVEFNFRLITHTFKTLIG